MNTESRCREVEGRLTEAFLSRREIGDSDARHVDECGRCQAARLELSRLGELLEAPLPELSPARARSALDAARATLADPDADAFDASAPEIPPGFGRELTRLLIFAGLPIPLLVLGYAGLVQAFDSLLADLLPAFLAPAVGLGLAVAAASWLGLVYGSLPFVAHRRALRRNEVIA